MNGNQTTQNSKGRPAIISIIIGVLLIIGVIIAPPRELISCIFPEKTQTLLEWSVTTEGQKELAELNQEINNEWKNHSRIAGNNNPGTFNLFVDGSDKLVFQYRYTNSPTTQKKINEFIQSISTPDMMANRSNLAGNIKTIRNTYKLNSFVMEVQHADINGKVFYSFVLTEADAK